jgi:23S rRNA (adenine2503-C2)-methyltransferase
MQIINSRTFANGTVYALRTDDGFPIETTDTFLPYYTKEASINGSNKLRDSDFGNRNERWMIGVSVMSGCPIGCKFCQTAKLPRWRNLSAEEIIAQVEFIISQNPGFNFGDAKEHKINYTRMGEPFLNLDAVQKAIKEIDRRYPGTHHYVSTVGLKGSNFDWIKENITLQVSLHSLDEVRRNDLIPIARKMTISELGKIRTNSNLKTTVNLTLVSDNDFDITVLRENFEPDSFFIKVSPINPNEVSKKNNLGSGIIKGNNLG